MDEIKKQLLLLSIFICFLGIFVVLYKSDAFWDIAKGLPLHTNSGNCIRINDKICLSEDAGLRTDYYEASSLCSKRGMKLPTKQDAWDIWINSENCHRTFASNINVAKDQKAFLDNCKDDVCTKPAMDIKKYCSKEPSIKFPRASQYTKGGFWLRDSAEENEHYAINYSTGKITAFKDNTKSLGVRCIRK